MFFGIFVLNRVSNLSSNINIIYYVFVLISSLFYFFSSRLRRGDQSTVFCIVSNLSFFVLMRISVYQFLS